MLKQHSKFFLKFIFFFNFRACSRSFLAWQSETGWSWWNLSEPRHDQVRQERVQLQRPLHKLEKFTRGKDTGKFRNDVTQKPSLFFQRKFIESNLK